MSLRALPLIVIPFILYNVIVLFGSSVDPGGVLGRTIFRVPMMHGTPWGFTWGDLLLLITMLVLFVEIVKSTYTSATSLLDHGLSMLVFIVCLIEFLMVKQASTSVFFLITVAAVIDVVAGYTIGIRVAKRDLQFGQDH
jgi:hypothetical protein